VGLPERVARNEAIFREVNERIVGIGDEPDDETPLDLVCECSDTSCADRVAVIAREYEAVRGNPRRFIVVPGHVGHPKLEREVARLHGYAIVEKVEEAGDVAAETDPRGDDESEEV
jgi:hypothetical protein